MIYGYLAVVILALMLYTIQTLAAMFRFRRTAPEQTDSGKEELPPVSVLKPLKGLDDQLEENLASFCEQDHPDYEIIFCVQDRDDPAVDTARRIIARYPHRSLFLVVHKTRIGLNPKINNIAGGYEKAAHDLILISDSNVRVDPGYLRNIILCHTDPGIGLVSNMILGTGARSLGASLENLHLNSFIFSSINFLDRFRDHQIVVGKSMLFSRRDLEEIGGLEIIKDVLAEDYVMGRYIRDSGRKVHISPHTIQNVNVHWNLSRFWKRHVRWGQLRLSLAGPGYAWEMAVNPVFLAIIPFLGGQVSEVTLGVALTSSAYKSLGDYFLGKRLGVDLKAGKYLLVPFKDLLVGLMWFYPILFRTVTWREHTYRIARGSRLREIEVPEDMGLARRILWKLRTKAA